MEGYKVGEGVLHQELCHNAHLIKKLEDQQLVKPESCQSEWEPNALWSTNVAELSQMQKLNTDAEDKILNNNSKQPTTLAVPSIVVSREYVENKCDLGSQTLNDDVTDMAKSSMTVRKKCGKARRLRPRVVCNSDDEIEFEGTRNGSANKSKFK